MFKELLISFLVCLVIGAIFNGINVAPPAPTATQTTTETTTTEVAPSTSTEENPETSADKALESSDASFDQDVLKAEVPVMVDFGASWCVPCKNMSPIIDKLAKDYSGRVKFVKIDVEKNPIVRDKYEIQSLPTFVVFRGGQKMKAYSGQMPQEMLAGVIDSQLGIQ